MLAYLLAFTTCAFLACGVHLLAFLDPLASPLRLDIIGKMYVNFIWNAYNFSCSLHLPKTHVSAFLVHPPQSHKKMNK
jgi:hypothetical protein